MHRISSMWRVLRGLPEVGGVSGGWGGGDEEGHKPPVGMTCVLLLDLGSLGTLATVDVRVIMFGFLAIL
jgi:hypothetical protein